jgi:competence protein ComEA
MKRFDFAHPPQPFKKIQSVICGLRSIWRRYGARISQSLSFFSWGQQWVLFALALFLLGWLYLRFYPRSFSSHSEKVGAEKVVELIGQVRTPGIHFFERSPTLQEAIQTAGGLKEIPLPDSAPLSERLETGTLVTVEREREEVTIKLGRMEARKLLVFAIPLDLNRVSAEDLCLIPGIGESLAREMIAYRQRRKGFRSLEDIKNVKGIGEKKWEELKPFFTVDSP